MFPLDNLSSHPPGPPTRDKRTCCSGRIPSSHQERTCRRDNLHRNSTRNLSKMCQGHSRRTRPVLYLPGFFQAGSYLKRSKGDGTVWSFHHIEVPARQNMQGSRFQSKILTRCRTLRRLQQRFFRLSKGSRRFARATPRSFLPCTRCTPTGQCLLDTDPERNLHILSIQDSPQSSQPSTESMQSMPLPLRSCLPGTPSRRAAQFLLGIHPGGNRRNLSMLLPPPRYQQSTTLFEGKRSDYHQEEGLLSI